jgi:hypothetical protein
VIKVKDVLKPISDDELEKLFENLSIDHFIKYGISEGRINEYGDYERIYTIAFNRNNKHFIKRLKCKFEFNQYNNQWIITTP